MLSYIMSRNNQDLTSQIYDLLISKIEDYQDTVEENKKLFDRLLQTIKTKSQDRSLEVNKELVSRIEDVLEDSVTMNVTTKLILESVAQQTNLTLSTRESERTVRHREWDRVIRENNLLPVMFLLYYNLIQNQVDRVD